MKIIHTIKPSDICQGDNIYVRSTVLNRMKREGIVIAGSNFNRAEQWLVIYRKQQIQSENFELYLGTLEEFTDHRLKIRRKLYGQDGLLHRCKLNETSYTAQRADPDVIANNARILYHASRLPFRDQKKLANLIGSTYEKFSYICSTTNSKDWQIGFEFHHLSDQPCADVTSPPSNPNSSDENVSNITDTTERTLSKPKYRWSYRVNIKDLKRGDHIYSYRKGCLYQHHGIVISKDDISPEIGSSLAIIEDLMVVENNRTTPNIRIVTINEFAANYAVRRVQYGMHRKRDMLYIHYKSSGKCHLEDAIEPEKIVKNALFLYEHCRRDLPNNAVSPLKRFFMKAYNLISYNCEHFAYVCCTDENLIEHCTNEESEPELKSQQLATICNYSSKPVNNITWHVMQQAIRWEEFINILIPNAEMFSRKVVLLIQRGISTKIAFKNFIRCAGPMIGIVAAASCFMEILVLIIRYASYRFGKKRKYLLACGFAITRSELIEGIFRSIIANGLAVGFSLLAGSIAMAIPVPGLNIFLSLLLSTVGYMLGQYLTGVAVNFNRRRKYLKKKAEKNKTKESESTQQELAIHVRTS